MFDLHLYPSPWIQLDDLPKVMSCVILTSPTARKCTMTCLASELRERKNYGRWQHKCWPEIDCKRANDLAWRDTRLSDWRIGSAGTSDDLVIL